jgi:hypothetical protein
MSNETPIQQASREARLAYQDRQGKTGAFEASVVSVQGSNDSMSLAFGPTPSRSMPIQHPFTGTTSWIRSVPETGSKYLLQNRFDTGQPEALKTLPVIPGQRSQDYLSGFNLYRTLDAGEHDMVSSGAAAAFWGKRGHLDLRSGANIKAQLSRDGQHSLLAAPTHKRHLLSQTVGTMGDEERLGIVKRWTTAVDEVYPQDANQKFQAEHYLQLVNPAGSAPAVLLRHVDGQVYGDDGTLSKHFTTALPLRSQRFWYTTTDDFVRQEIDENGNMLTILPTTATVGHELMIPQGNFRLDVGVDRDVTIGGDDKANISGNLASTVQGTMSYTVTESVNVTAGGNALTMDVTEGQETVGLVNAQLLGFQAENTSDGGLTTIFGPSNSGIYLNGKGYIQVSDGAGGGATYTGDAVTQFTSGGALLALGDTTLLSGTSGADYVSIEDQLVQICSGNTITMTAQVFNVNGGTIFLGANAIQPAVLGLTAMAWLDTHVHSITTPVPGSPTTPPLIPTATFIGTPASLYSLAAFFAPNI